MKSAKGNEGRPHQGGEVEQDASRRAVMAKIGRFAYVAPALMILAEPKLAEAYGKGLAKDVPPGPPSNVPPGQQN